MNKPDEIKEEQKPREKIIIDGKECEIVNSVTVMEIIAHKLDNGREIQQVIAQEFMMVDHKPYMIKCLTDAINTIMRAQRRENKIVKAGHIPRITDIFRRR